MQMQIPHNLVVLVVSLGLFASATPQFGVPQACPFEQVTVPVEVVKTCPQPEIISIKTVYRTVRELVPNCGCTDDFTDFANVQLIADTACRNGLVFTPGLRTRKRGIFERAPTCQSYSIVEKPQAGALKRRDGASGGLSDLIHKKFDTLSESFRHNVNQNINNNGNIDEDDTQETSGGGRGRGFGGFKKSKRWGGGGGGRGRGFDGGDFDDNDNQNINQNVNANQNLMANLGKFNSFFGERHGRMGGDGFSGSLGGLSGLGFGNNDNTDFNVNNNVAFEDTGFFKAKRSFGGFGGFDDGAFSDNNNQNINQNINNNQNLNENFFKGVFGNNGEDGFDGGIGVIPFFPGFIGDCDRGFGFDGFGNGGGEMNENFNVNDDINGNRRHNGRFGGSGGFDKAKRSLKNKRGHFGFDGREALSSNRGNANVNINSNINNNNLQAVEETAPVIETIPIVETVFRPTFECETVECVETIPVIEETFEPVQVIEQIARPAPVEVFESFIPQIKAKVIEDKFHLSPIVEQITPVEQIAPVEQISQPVNVVETVAQPQVEVIQPIEINAPVAVQIQPVVEYEAVFFEAPSCGVPNHPSFTAPRSCGNDGFARHGTPYGTGYGTGYATGYDGLY